MTNNPTPPTPDVEPKEIDWSKGPKLSPKQARDAALFRMFFKPIPELPPDEDEVIDYGF